MNNLDQKRSARGSSATVALAVFSSTVALILVVILATTVSYTKTFDATGLSASLVNNSLATTQAVSLDNEAQQQGGAYWKRILTKCGDSYFFVESHRIYEAANASQPQKWYQAKGQPAVRVTGTYHPPRRLTEAERLNRVDSQPVEWEGKIRLTFRVGRVMKSRGYGYDDRPPARYAWQDDFSLERTILKKKGSWDIYDSAGDKDIKVPCTEVDEIISGSLQKHGSNSNLGCEFNLGVAIRAKWIEAGREGSVLGCPAMEETDASESPRGTNGRYADFKGGNGFDPGTIHLHTSGTYKGRAFITRGAIFALYKSLGGSSSWLGFPVSDEHDVPGGRRSDFEGGFIHWNSETGETRASRY